ncbi:MAG: iron-sulfur cluster assembly accessory protein [Methyloprofundus sp.]|nr:iron-sulfur cluster assembly accessory protein [Methyloprofundus sp.]
MAVELTESAAKQIKKQLDNRGEGLGLKLGVKKSGCSGFAYTIAYADKLEEGDKVYETFGVNVVVANENIETLNGLVLDFAKEGINEAFKFNNPNVKGTCGCGESFSV